MKIKYLAALLVICGCMNNGSGATVPLDSPDSWRALGTAPVKKSFDAQEKCLRFDITREPGKTGKLLIFPLFQVSHGMTMHDVVYMTFEIKIVEKGGTPSKNLGSIVLPKQGDVHGYFNFPLPESGKWGNAEVIFVRKNYNMSKVGTLQIQIESEADEMSVFIRNITLGGRDGKELNSLKYRTAHRLVPIEPLDFFVQPEVPSRLRFAMEKFNTERPLDYIVSDYFGKKIASGETIHEMRNAVVSYSFPQGYFELYFPGTGQRFGVVSRPKATTDADEFWGINTIFSVKNLRRPEANEYQNGIWKKPKTFDSYFGILQYCGIARVREMAGFYLRAPAPDELHLDSAAADKIRASAMAHNCKILTFYAHFPEWLGTDRPHRQQLTDYLRFREVFLKMIEAEAPAACGVQIYNENDTASRKAPPDGTLAMTWAVRELFKNNMIATPVIGMAFAFQELPPLLLKQYAANGLFEVADMIAFNYYHTPEKFKEHVVANFDLIARYSKRIPPPVITETNRAYPIGPLRALPISDRLSAESLVRKSAYAKAFGFKSCYAFCMPFFEENTSNFGLFDHTSTPQRTFGAYAALVERLSHRRYVGDLSAPGADDDTAQLFVGDSGEAVALVCGNRTKYFQIPSCWNVLRVEAIDGSPLTFNADGMVALEGGLIYCFLPDIEKLSGAINTKTEFNRIAELLKKSSGEPAKSFPVILRHHFEKAACTANGYEHDGSPVAITVSAYNFSSVPQNIELELFCNGKSVGTLPEKTIVAGSEKEFQWEVTIPHGKEADLVVRDHKGASSPLALYFAPKELIPK